jgi:hypothetical protein
MTSDFRVTFHVRRVGCINESGKPFVFDQDCRFFFASADPGTPLYQFQIVHECRPSIMFGFAAAFRAFLPMWDAELQSLGDLEQKRAIRVVLSGSADDCDPDGVGVKPWRAAIYAATANPGSVLDMLSAFAAQRQRASEFGGRQLRLEVARSAENLFPNGLVEPWVWMPVGVVGPRPFEAAPLRGKHHIILQVVETAVILLSFPVSPMLHDGGRKFIFEARTR